MNSPEVLKNDDTVTYDITPELAKSWLVRFRYDGQRTLSRAHVCYLVGQIEAERLRFSSLRLTGYPGDEKGADGKPKMRWFLTNGQHRLEAVIESGQAVRFGVERVKVATYADVARDYAEQDNIRNRSASDSFVAMGVGEREDLLKSQVGALHRAVRIIASDFSLTNKNLPMLKSRVALAEVIEPWLAPAVEFFKAIENSPNAALLLHAPVMAPALATFGAAPETAIEFWATMAADDGLRAGDARRTLLYFLRETERRERGLLLLGVAHCWAAFCEGRDIVKCDVIKGAKFSLLRTRWEVE